MRLSTAVLLGFIMFGLLGCGGGSSRRPRPLPTASAGDPTFSVDRFDANSAVVTNEFLPLLPGSHFTYEGLTDEGDLETIEIFVSHLTRTVLGIECVVVVDRAYEDGELIEETFDWYAQDTEGYVWYMGEESTEYEDGEAVGTTGSWEAGKDVAGLAVMAEAGILMKADPQPGGDSYYQEFYEGEAEDEARVEDIEVPVALADGTHHLCLKTREWSALEPGIEEFKYYAPELGLVVEEKVGGIERIELIDDGVDTNPDIDAGDFPDSTVIDNPYLPMVPGTTHTYEAETEDGKETIIVEVLFTVRTVMGIDCVIVRDRVFLEGVLIEDTHDWYAQDDDGNVWYMGEDVDNYEYDDDGVLLEVNHDGAWESGVSGAVPGIVMKAEPRVGDSYRQEYWEGEAEDMGAVVELNVPVTLSGGESYICLKTRDWTPLEPDAIEFKYYAPGIGVVREESADGEETVDLVDFQIADPLTILDLFLVDEMGLADARAVFTGDLPVSLSRVTLIAPDGRVVLREEFEDAGGRDEFSFESPAPSLTELEQAWPKGRYVVLATTIDDEMRIGLVNLTYD